MTEFNFEFNTWSEFVDKANYDLEKHISKGYCRTSRQGRIGLSYEFQHVNTFDEALDLAHKGWKDGLKESTELSSRVERKLCGQIEREDVVYDVTGEMLDIGRFCAGDPEHWGVWNSTVVEGKGSKLIHIVCNGTASAGVDKSVLIRRGAMVAAFVNLAELGGYRAKVTLAYKSGCGKVSTRILTTLKDFDGTMDQDMLAFALAHPAAFRCLGFSIWDQADNAEVQNMLGMGYGHVRELAENERGDIYLQGMTSNDENFTNPRNAERWVVRELTKLGVLKQD